MKREPNKISVKIVGENLLISDTHAPPWPIRQARREAGFVWNGTSWITKNTPRARQVCEGWGLKVGGEVAARDLVGSGNGLPSQAKPSGATTPGDALNLTVNKKALLLALSEMNGDNEILIGLDRNGVYIQSVLATLDYGSGHRSHHDDSSHTTRFVSGVSSGKGKPAAAWLSQSEFERHLSSLSGNTITLTLTRDYLPMLISDGNSLRHQNLTSGNWNDKGHNKYINQLRKADKD